MQHTTGVAVVTTQLAGTDRRALSQAWYSALHLAERPPVPPQAPRATALFGAARGGAQAASDTTTLQRGATDFVRGARVAARAGRHDPGAVDGERRVPKTELARRIERGLTRRLPRAAASFAVRGAGGRVALLLRTDGARTRIVAVCAPPLRERVERALAHARFALAGRGVRAEVA